MARLPEIPRRGELTRAPSHSASSDVVSSPYRAIAAIFGSVGEQLQDISNEMAPQAGANAVTRDDNGELSVRFMSPVTQYGRNFNRAAASSLLSRQASAFETSAAEMARQANGDIASFDQMWAEFSRQRIERAPAYTRAGTTQLLEEIGGAQHRGITSAQYNRDMSRFHDDLVAERSRLAAQLSTLAYQGGAGSPEFAQMAARYRDIGLEMSENPAFTISREAQQWADDQFQAELVIEQVRGDVARRFALSPNEARAYAEQIINDPNLPLTAEQRRVALGAVMQQFTASSSEYRLAIDAYRDAAEPVLTALRDTQLPFDPVQVQQLIEQGLAVGDFTTVVEIQRWARNRGFLMGFEGDPNQVDTYNRQFAWASGEPQRFLSERAGSARVEGLNADFGTRLANLAAAAEAATGERVQINSLVRTREEQANLYAAYQAGEIGLAAPPGQSRHETGTAADIQGGAALAWMHEHAAEFGLAFLTGDAFRDDPGHIQLAGPPVDFPVTPEVFTAERTIMGDELRGMLDRADALVTAGTGIDAEQAATIIDYAAAVNDPDLTRRAADAVAGSMAQTMVNGLTPEQGEAFLTQLASPDAGGGDAYLANVLRDAAATVLAHQNDLRANNPILLGHERGYYQVQPIDWSTPEAMTAGLRAREGQLALLSDAEGTPYRTLLQPQEAAALGQQWTTMDTNARLAVASSFANAIEDGDVLRGTLAQFAGGEANTMAVAGAIYRQNPAAAEGIIRGEALLAANGRLAPKDEEWFELVDAAFPPSLFGGNGALEGVRQGILEAARFRYVSLAYDNPDETPLGAISETLVGQALRDVTGGAVTFNGEDIIAPVYGMTQAQFDRSIAGSPERTAGGVLFGGGTIPAAPGIDPRATRNAVTGDGLPIAWEDIQREAHFEAVGDGQYLVRFGSGETATYARDQRTGEAFVLDLGFWITAPTARRIAERFGPGMTVPAAPAPAPAAAPPATVPPPADPGAGLLQRIEVQPPAHAAERPAPATEPAPLLGGGNAPVDPAYINQTPNIPGVVDDTKAAGAKPRGGVTKEDFRTGGRITDLRSGTPTEAYDAYTVRTAGDFIDQVENETWDNLNQLAESMDEFLQTQGFERGDKQAGIFANAIAFGLKIPMEAITPALSAVLQGTYRLQPAQVIHRIAEVTGYRWEDIAERTRAGDTFPTIPGRDV